MKYYIACKLEDVKSHHYVRDKLKELGYEISYDWTEHGPVWREGLKRCQEISEKELQGVKDAAFVVVLMNGGRGTHVELGAALALNKIVYLVTDRIEDYTVNEKICAFYCHRLVKVVTSVDHLIRVLT